MSTTTLRTPWFHRPFFRSSLAIIAAVFGGVLVFEALDISVFRRIGMPHEFCYLRDPKLVWLHVTSDVLIGSAYVSISLTLAYLVYRASKDIPFNWVFLAFGLFIVSCGLTHFMEVWVIWDSVYWLSGYVKVVTAAASVATALALFPLLPKVFAFIAEARKSEERRTQIEQLNQELERFNYSVAHDLRAPLRGISGFGQALREDYAAQLPEEAKAYIQRMQESAERMDQLISDLLKYATVGRQELRLRAVALDEVLRVTRSFLSAEIERSRAELVLAPHLPTVRGDATLLQVVFQNLIANSLKFVAPGVRPRIEITATTHERNATIRLTDNGLGIPPEARERIFQIFERFHPTHPGTGIGLPIVHRAIERLGGRIGVEPAPVGTGTRFWIELPLA
jgi:chemotaxis family two-component system sensor kinase Cph1